jgi:hypothetical protein
MGAEIISQRGFPQEERRTEALKGRLSPLFTHVVENFFPLFQNHNI